jgi:tRNA (guanine-N7-)-methyltransferase
VIDLSGKKTKRLDRRMKKMTNPLAIQYSTPAPAVDWAAVFTDPSLPLFLDIGCSKGRFLHNLAQSTAYERDHGGKWNFCGVEIYDSLVRAANATFKTPNLHYISANINPSCRSLQFPAQLRRVSIQFPDPWFEEKKKIRRVVNADIAAWLSDALPGGGVGEVYICSDVLELAVEMKAILLATGAFALHSLHSPLSALEPSLEWLPSRPWQVPTERDVVCEINWRPVHRALLTRL